MAERSDPGLEGQIAVVTGGASGIGRAAVDLLEAAGARVFVADLNESDGPGEFICTDVTVDAAIEALSETVLERAGAPHVLVNAAGWECPPRSRCMSCESTF